MARRDKGKEKSPESQSESFDLTVAGTDLGGAVAGEFLTSLIPAPLPIGLGAALGVGCTQTLRYLVNEAKNRFFSPRERRRVMTILGLIALAIEREQKQGRTPRDDDFFDREVDGRTSAQELGEAVLYAARDEHEERKLPYLANLFTFCVFESRFDQGTANYMVKIASSLTYRQYCILALVLNPSGAGLHPAPFNQSNRNDPFQVLSALTECFELYRQDLITFRREELIQRVEDMPLDSVSLHDSGARLCLAMKLATIPSEDVASVAALLK